MNATVLMSAGLTQKEAEVYLALLELGSVSASGIIRRTGLHRAVVYDLLNRLIEKGLASYVMKGKKKFFESTNPNRLMDIIKEKEDSIRTVLPQLLELSKFSEHLDVKIFKGTEGIKAVYEQMLDEKPGIWYSMGSSGETFKLLPAYLDEFHERRIKLKIHAKGLLLQTADAKKRGFLLSRKPLTEIRYLPKTFVTPTISNIYNNKVTFYAVTGNKVPFIILIENEHVAHSFQEYFEWAWALSNKI